MTDRPRAFKRADAALDRLRAEAARPVVMRDVPPLSLDERLARMPVREPDDAKTADGALVLLLLAVMVVAGLVWAGLWAVESYWTAAIAAKLEGME